MKESLLVKIGKWLMKKGAMKICIIDDEETYFTPSMLRMADAAGFPNIERYAIVDEILYSDLQNSPRDILILDVKGIVDEKIAKDGLAIAQSLHRTTPTFIAITSAHKFYLNDFHRDFDYIVEDRLLTAVDFIEELRIMVRKNLDSRKKFYESILLRVGLKLSSKAILSV